MAVALGQAGYCGQHIPEPLVIYRREGQNRSLTNGNQRETFLQQMKATFPALYRGERPMGCCGGRRTPTRGPLRGQPPALRIGAEGMTLLEYIGINAGRTTVYGEFTGQRYTAKGPGATFYADNRDVPALLDMVLQRRPSFRRYVAPKTPPLPAVEAATIEAAPAPEPVVEQALVAAAPKRRRARKEVL